MNILVTGGAGYKGVMLTQELLKLGHDVTIIDNFMYGYESVLHLVSNPSLTIRQLDIRNIAANDVCKADIIFHLAGISGMPACAANPHSAETINVLATQKLVSNLSSEQRLIYASTTSIYGTSTAKCDELVSVQPPSLYAKTKYEAEHLIMARPNSIALRFATVFGVGSRMRSDLIVNDFAYKAVVERSLVLFGRDSKRTCMHISDAVSGYLFALDHFDLMNGNIYNVGDETLNYSKREIADAIGNVVKFEIIDSSIPDFDTRDFVVSFAKIRALGYKTRCSLQEGILELIKLYGFYRVYSSFRVI